MKRLFVAAALAAFACAGEASAWGSTGHRIVGVLAAEKFPKTLPSFMRTRQAVQDVGELAREPDRWKGDVGRLHDAMREPHHFIDFDDEGKVLGGPHMDAMPATYQDYEKALHAVGQDTTKAGLLYYSIIDGTQQLAKNFAYWRALTAIEKRERNRARKAWYAQDRRRREALIMRDLGVLAHYVGDGSQPMHLSVHYNGWGDYPNPQGFTTDRGTHSRFEGAFVRDNIAIGEVRSRMAPARACPTTLEACVLEYLKRGYGQIVPFYTLEKAGGFAPGDRRGKDFATDRLAEGASMLRDLTTYAWDMSADVTVGWSPVSIQDIESGKADPWVPMLGKD